MPKFMCTHSLPPNTISRDQFCQVAAASQQDPTVKGLQSFANLSQGKIFCVWEAPKSDAVVAWFKKMEIPYDAITPLEVIGQGGSVVNA